MFNFISFQLKTELHFNIHGLSALRFFHLTQLF